MGELIIFDEKGVAARGKRKGEAADQEKIKNYFFKEDYDNLNLLDNVPKIGLGQALDRPVLFYPGCGADILTPLIYLEKLFPALKKAELFFVDEIDFKGIIKTILDRAGISFSEEEERTEFYWGELEIKMSFVTGDVFSMEWPEFNIYFEKAFRIMKEQKKDYEKKVFERLASGGVLISDSGFRGLGLKELAVPAELSSYKEMIIGLKLSD